MQSLLCSVYINPTPYIRLRQSSIWNCNAIGLRAVTPKAGTAHSRTKPKIQTLSYAYVTTSNY